MDIEDEIVFEQDTSDLKDVVIKEELVSVNVPDNDVLDVIKYEVTVSELAYCDNCGDEFQDLSTLKQHIKVQHEVSNLASTNVNSENGLAESESFTVIGNDNHGQDIKKFTNFINTCSTVIKNLINPTEKSVDNGEWYSCNQCRKSFKDRNYLKRHQLIHTNERPYSCEICDKSFKSSSNLYTHKLRHTNAKSYACDECSSTFNYRSGLISHKQTHANDQSYSCDECSKLFNHKLSLKRHKLMHLNERSYSCDQCSKAFNYKSGLDSHKLTHSREIYACEVCGKTFKRKLGLDGHRFTHS